MKNDKYKVSFPKEYKIVFASCERYAEILAQAEMIKEGKDCLVLKI